MGWHDPDLYPPRPFLTNFPGGSVIVIARTSRLAEQFVRETKGCQGKVSAGPISEDEAYACTQQGVETVTAPH